MNSNEIEISEVENLDIEKFRNWLKSSHTAFISLSTVVISIIGNGVALYLKWKHLKTEAQDTSGIYNYLFTLNYTIQFALLTAIYFIYSKLEIEVLSDINTSRAEKYIRKITALSSTTLELLANGSLKKLAALNISLFNNYWRKFWGSLLFLYVFFLIAGIVENHGPKEIFNSPYYIILSSALEVFLNNFGGVCLFMCFLLLQQPINMVEQKMRISEQRNQLHEHFFPLIMLILLVSILHLGAMFYFPNWQDGTQEDILAQANYWNKLFKTLSGIINCIAIALFIGRLDSKFIHIRSWLITILYIYAAVQPLYAFFGDDELIKCIVLYAVLFSKVHFFLIVSFAIKTHRLSDFVLTFPYLRQLVESEGWLDKE